MDRNTIRKEITALVSSIKIQSDSLENERYPSQLDLELFLHKVEKLYQKSIVFNHLSLFDGFEESEMNTSRILSTPVNRPIQEPVKETVQPHPPVKESQPVNAAAPPAEKAVEPAPVKKEEVQKKSSSSALPDLKSSIGINDKFQFTNELFKGNMQEFNIAIEQLNASETHASALAYLTGLRRLYNWDDENETVKRWLSIIERRYS